MPAAIAFFPWVATDEPVEIGPLRLLPYVRGKSPGDLPRTTQSDIDGVLSAYANRPNKMVKKATLIELGDWFTGMDAEPYVGPLFQAQMFLGFAALSKRRLFRQHSDYCNFDTFLMVIQRYTAGLAGSFSFTTRRRDGITNHLWGSDEFAFHRPSHVDPHARLSFDRDLLAALLGSPGVGPAHTEAITDFNHANTDSHEVQEHVEIVMMKAAFEWLLGIGEKTSAFSHALTQLLHDIPPVEVDGPLKAKWLSARSAPRPLIAWAREFCALRGVSAHGQERRVSSFVWSQRTHLAFASIFLPLVFKKVLDRDGLLALSVFEREYIRRIESLLMFDPFDHDWANHEREHPWSEVDSAAWIHSRRHDLKNIIHDVLGGTALE